MKRTINKASTSELVEMWEEWDKYLDVEETCSLEFHYEDIHEELNRRGEGKYCAV